MPKSPNQKLKLLYLLKIFEEETDDEHGLTISQIRDMLSGYGVSSERKSLYDDFEALRQFGADIIGEKDGASYRYHIGKRDFETAELKLLIDAVQSARFITEKKSTELIKKIEKLAGKNEARKLQRQVFVTGRTKALNENVYYNVELIYEAMGKDVKLGFQYFFWDEKKRMVLKNDGEPYRVSPRGLIWDDENYYLVAYDGKDGIIKHYRVDKMLMAEVLYSEKRDGADGLGNFDPGKYSEKMFGMFSGKEERVRLECENRLAGVMIDRFGKDVMLKPLEGTGRFEAAFNACVSPQLMGWIFGLGSGIRILGPESLKEMFRERVKEYEDI